MEKLLTHFKKITASTLVFAIIFIFSFGFLASGTYAQTTTKPTVFTPQSGTQADIYTNGNTNPTADQTGQLVGDALGGAASCLGSKYVSGLISQAIGLIVPSKYYKVGTISGGDVGKTGGLELLDPPSLDSVGYCVINIMIQSLADSTIAWINGGFNGNPAFVNNPEQFFTDLADQQTAGFARDVLYGATGIDVCQPFRVEIATGLGNPQTSPGFGPTSCTLGQIGKSAQDFDLYTSGQSSQSGNLSNWITMTQNPQNNRYGAYLQSQDQLMERIALKQNTARIDLSQGNGFLSIQKCNPNGTTTDGTGKDVEVRGACQITTPGHMIEDSANATLRQGKDRLVMADKFDQVIDALVNQLIKTSLDQILNKNGSN